MAMANKHPKMKIKRQIPKNSNIKWEERFHLLGSAISAEETELKKLITTNTKTTIQLQPLYLENSFRQ